MGSSGHTGLEDWAGVLLFPGQQEAIRVLTRGGTRAGVDFQKVTLAAGDGGRGQSMCEGPGCGFALVHGGRWWRWI